MELLELQPEMTIAAVRPAPSSSGGVSSGTPATRHPGPHVSDMIRDLENTLTKPGKRRPYDELLPGERKRMGGYVEVGWAFEEMVRTAMLSSYYRDTRERFVSPGEIELDGIYGTPDWFDVEDECVEEFKATYRSSRRPIMLDFWSWFVQIKSYCMMTGTRWARLRVFFVNGNYRESGPQFKLWQMRFTDEELIANWTMITNHARRLGRL